ncbi:uncharacterized protein LOC106180799 [Lingula anatina]|uniref:Uncharacterized protein LOC106180799 n=1 Tax=Lingula anatina TaxID=7574 RepID=A0A1S3KDQ1_LINAN|nr:uncharacterized protein LOC106180799 [Lingula anatina]|eukprot:XP_013420386.1 uncharacterized protein LOC106180799 [Lingula anatina]
MTTYDEWPLKKLKEELRRRRARVSGRKKDLIDRLVAYDRMCLTGQEESKREYQMLRPDDKLYKDVAGSVIKTSQEFVDQFLLPLGTSLNKLAMDMYKDRFIRFIRFCKTESFIFVRAQCRAKMRRAVTYTIDIKLEQDGYFLESQCECKAGEGPSAHCKHVRACMLAILDCSNGNKMVLETTCTAELQSFHRPKKIHYGSPIKTANVPSRSNNSKLIFNPIPEQFNETPSAVYSRVANASINFAANTSANPAILQLFPPANLRAVYSDHDYNKLSPEDQFLESENITAINATEMQKVKTATMGQNTNKIWYSERCKRITSSNFGKICKMKKADPGKAAKELQSVKQLNTKPIRHGQRYEFKAVREYEKISGVTVQKTGLWVDASRPYLAASPDGIVSVDKILEVKCPYSSKEQIISPVTVPYLEYDNNGQLKLKKNHDYMYQVQGAMHITKTKKCDFAVFTLKDIKIISITYDIVMVEEMLKKLDDFFVKHFRRVYLERYLYHESY